MKESRETFFEDFSYFKKNLTPRMLYVKSEGRLGHSKQHDVFYYSFASFLVIGVALALLELKPIFVLPVMGIMVSFLIANLLDLFFIRRSLKSKGLPFAWEFYKWNCDELENDRVKRIIPEYKIFSIEVLQQLVEIAKTQKQRYEKIPEYHMIKAFEFLAKNIYLISIGLMIYYYQQQSLIEVLKELYQYLLIIMLFGFFLAGFWNLLIKKSLSERAIRNTKLLEDYIFVLNNILLIRKMRIERSITSENFENNYMIV
ncbi:hypothetical protein [Aquimarina latercula]|uniref:hypothetical protein n=1 Tax=Aquimarina latercula TaxID=987 RepID=UPI000480D43E|nr:hypothetical protein [Aquimarina latercula]